MQFARKIVSAEKIIGIMELPDELRHREVEIIVLPVNDDKTRFIPQEHKVDIIDRLLETPLILQDFKPFTRNEIYER